MSTLTADNNKMSKIRDFVKYNWWLFSIGIWFAALAPFYVWYDLKESNNEIKQLIKKDMESVIMASPDGRVFKIKKESVSVDTDQYKNYLLNVAKQFIYSQANLTKGFRYNPLNPIDLYKEIPEVKLSIKTYFANKQVVTKFLKLYYETITTDELAEYVALLDSEILDFKFLPKNNDDKVNKNPKWRITLKYKVALNYWLKEKDKTEEREDYYAIRITGYSDPLKHSTINNPYGLKILNIGVDIPKKRIEE